MSSTRARDQPLRDAVSEPLSRAGIKLTDEVLGRGTYALVYRGELSSGQSVAIKCLHNLYSAHYYTDEAVFQAEAGVANGGLPLLSVLDLACSPVLVTPYVKAVSFEALVRRASLDDARRYIRALLMDLQQIHALGIVHRDLKPRNFLYDEAAGTGCVADFGLAELESSLHRKAIHALYKAETASIQADAANGNTRSKRGSGSGSGSKSKSGHGSSKSSATKPSSTATATGTGAGASAAVAAAASALRPANQQAASAALDSAIARNPKVSKRAKDVAASAKVTGTAASGAGAGTGAGAGSGARPSSAKASSASGLAIPMGSLKPKAAVATNVLDKQLAARLSQSASAAASMAAAVSAKAEKDKTREREKEKQKEKERERANQADKENVGPGETASTATASASASASATTRAAGTGAAMTAATSSTSGGAGISDVNGGGLASNDGSDVRGGRGGSGGSSGRGQAHDGSGIPAAADSAGGSSGKKGYTTADYIREETAAEVAARKDREEALRTLQAAVAERAAVTAASTAAALQDSSLLPLQLRFRPGVGIPLAALPLLTSSNGTAPTALTHSPSAYGNSSSSSSSSRAVAASPEATAASALASIRLASKWWREGGQMLARGSNAGSGGSAGGGGGGGGAVEASGSATLTPPPAASNSVPTLYARQDYREIESRLRAAAEHRPDDMRGLAAQAADRAGTPGWRAPEVLWKDPWQTTAVDIWSGGLMLLCLLARRFPIFPGRSDTNHQLAMMTLLGNTVYAALVEGSGKLVTRFPAASGADDPFLSQFSAASAGLLSIIQPERQAEDGFQAAFHLLLCMLDPDPRRRITAAAALQLHPFLNPHLVRVIPRSVSTAVAEAALVRAIIVSGQQQEQQQAQQSQPLQLQGARGPTHDDHEDDNDDEDDDDDGSEEVAEVEAEFAAWLAERRIQSKAASDQVAAIIRAAVAPTYAASGAERTAASRTGGASGSWSDERESSSGSSSSSGSGSDSRRGGDSSESSGGRAAERDGSRGRSLSHSRASRRSSGSGHAMRREEESAAAQSTGNLQQEEGEEAEAAAGARGAAEEQ